MRIITTATIYGDVVLIVYSGSALEKKIGLLDCPLTMGHFRVRGTLTRLLKRGQVQNLCCESEFYLHENKKNYFHINGFLALKQRLGEIRSHIFLARGHRMHDLTYDLVR